MYRKILVALDHTPADESLLPHVAELARLTGGELVLVHVATGWVANWGRQLNMEESQEMRDDATYLEGTAEGLRQKGIAARALLVHGEPVRELLKMVRAEGCDLIALTTHGHRFVVDLLLGSTIDKLRHQTDIPLLVVRGAPR